jgi:hypothetical protein
MPGIPVPFITVAGILRLATKYDVRHLREEAITRIRSCFPDQLSKWDTARQRDRDGQCLMDYEPGEEIAIANLVRSCHVKGVIHLVLYACCQLDSQLLFNGVSLKNGTVEKLAMDDLEICINGREGLSETNERLIEKAIWSFSSKCEQPLTCALERITFFKQRRHRFKYYDPLMRFSLLGAEKHMSCRVCIRHIELGHSRARKAVWESLAENFRVVESRSPTPES